MSLVHAPAWSFEKRSSYLETATRDALKYGLTSVHDAGATPDFIEVFQRCAHISLLYGYKLTIILNVSFADEGQLPVS